MPDSSPSAGVHEWFDANRTPADQKATFLVAGEATVTYSAIDEHTARFATFLDDHQIAPNAPIMVISHDPIEVGHLSLAILRTGRCLCVIDPTGSAREIRAALVVVEPAMVFAGSELIDRCGLRDDCVWTVVELGSRAAKTLASRLFAKRQAAAAPTTWPAVVDQHNPAPSLPELDRHACAVIVFTSGSTSRPKGVELSLHAMLTHFETLRRVFELDGSVVHDVLPLSHVDGLIQGPLMTYFNGATWVRPCEFTIAAIPELLDSVYRDRVTHMFVVPTMLALYERLASDMTDAFDTPDFQMIVSSAGILSTALWQRFESTFSTTVCNSYGLSETVTSSIACGPESSGTRRVGTIGKPIDCDVVLIDNDGQPAAPGEVGEITIRGEHLFSRYRNDPEATTAVLRNGAFHTGDLAAQDGDGYLTVHGRRSSMIIRGGRNISPSEIDSIVDQVDGVVQSCTVGVEDPMWGQRVESLVTTTGNVTTDALLEHCRISLAPYKVPQRLVITEAMPVTKSGKIDRNSVHDLLTRPETESVDGQTIEDVVIGAAARLFGVEAGQLSLSSSIDQLDGWDSLAHLDLVGALEDHFSIEMSNADILGIRNLADAASVVHNRTS